MWEFYINCFGYKLQARKLLEGVMKSVEYSGNQYEDDIKERISELRGRMNELENNIS